MTSTRTMSRRSRPLIACLIALALTLLLIAAIVYANRPHWNTYTSPPLPGTKLRLSVQMPDTWVADKWDGHDIPTWPGTVLSFHQRAPQGISKWLYEHIFHIKTSTWAKDRITFVLNVRYEGFKDIPTYLKWVKARHDPRSDPKLFYEYRFALGPALERQLLFPVGFSQYNSDNMCDVITILPDETTPGNEALNVYAGCEGDEKHFRQAHSTLLEAAKRLRLTTISPKLTPIHP